MTQVTFSVLHRQQSLACTQRICYFCNLTKLQSTAKKAQAWYVQMYSDTIVCYSHQSLTDSSAERYMASNQSTVGNIVYCICIWCSVDGYVVRMLQNVYVCCYKTRMVGG